MSLKRHCRAEDLKAVKCVHFFFFLGGGLIKNHVYVPPPRHDLLQLRHKIEEDIVAITSDLSTMMWKELYMTLDVCRTNKHALIEPL